MKIESRNIQIRSTCEWPTYSTFMGILVHTASNTFLFTNLTMQHFPCTYHMHTVEDFHIVRTGRRYQGWLSIVNLGWCGEGVPSPLWVGQPRFGLSIYKCGWAG